MSDQPMTNKKTRTINVTTAVLLVLPLVALGFVIALFIRTGGGLQLEAPAPVEALSIERTILKPDSIDIVVRNAGPEALTIAQVVINDALWPFTVNPETTIPRLSKAVVHLEYPWVYGEAYGATLFTRNAIPFDVDFDDENDFYAANTIPFHYQMHPIKIRVGEKVRIYLVNILEFDLINSIHLHANFFHYYPTGTSLTPTEYTDTIMQTQAQRGILEFSYKYPGLYMFHAHNTEFAELGWTGNFEVIA